MNLNDTTLTATSVSCCDDVDDPNASHDFSAHGSTDEELATPQDIYSSVSPNISLERTPTRGTSTSPPVIVPETSAEGGEPIIGRATADLEAKLQHAFDGLLGGDSLGSFEEMARKEKVIVTLDKLLEVFSGPCDAKDCSRSKEVWHKSQGGVLTIRWNCGEGHGDLWESSDVLIKKEQGQKVYVNTVVLAASILLTDNNFCKFALLTKCLNLGFISKATFDRIQRLYAIPLCGTFGLI